MTASHVVKAFQVVLKVRLLAFIDFALSLTVFDSLLLHHVTVL